MPVSHRTEGGGTESGLGWGWGLGRAQRVQDSRAGEGWADETQPPASGARQTIFALGSDVTRDNRLSQSPWAPKAELPLSRTRGTERKWSETPEALWPLERMERGPWDPLKCLTLHPSYSMGGFHQQREVQVSEKETVVWHGAREAFRNHLFKICHLPSSATNPASRPRSSVFPQHLSHSMALLGHLSCSTVLRHSHTCLVFWSV